MSFCTSIICLHRPTYIPTYRPTYLSIYLWIHLWNESFLSLYQLSVKGLITKVTTGGMLRHQPRIEPWLQKGLVRKICEAHACNTNECFTMFHLDSDTSVVCMNPSMCGHMHVHTCVLVRSKMGEPKSTKSDSPLL